MENDVFLSSLFVSHAQSRRYSGALFFTIMIFAWEENPERLLLVIVTFLLELI